MPASSVKFYKVAPGWKNFWEIKPLSEYNGAGDIMIKNDIDDAITVGNGPISVNSDSQVRIVAISGTSVYSGRGNCNVNVTPGIYVVIVGNTAHKVAVK